MAGPVYLDDNGNEIPVGPPRSRPGYGYGTPTYPAPPTATPPPAATTPPAAGNNGTPGHTTLTPQEYVTAWRQQHPDLPLKQSGSEAAWQQLAKDMKAVGFNVTLDTRSDGLHKGIMLDGGFVKLADGYDNPIYLPGGETPTSGGGFDMSAYDTGPFTKPWPGTFPEFQKAPAFTPTSEADVFADPGYKFRLDQGQKALTNSQAARGLANTGGSIKDFDMFTQSYASNEFANADARRRNDYSLNYGSQYLDPYTFAYQNALQNYNVFRNRQNDSFDKIYSTNNA
jgi:hypothetical protein